MTGHASLTIDIAGIPQSARPRIDVRDWDLRAVARISFGQEITLRPGRYVLILVRPDGQEEMRAVELAAGEPRHVLMADDLATQGLDLIGRASLVATSLHTRPTVDRPPWAEVDDELGIWYLRVVSGSTGLRVDVESPVSQLSPIIAPPGHTTIELDMLSPADEHEPLFAQVAKYGAIPLDVALPAAPGGYSRLRVDLDERANGVRAATAPAQRPDAALAAFAAYVLSGRVREAAEIAEGPLRREGPLQVVATALARLRAGGAGFDQDEVEPVRWLPDSYVLAGERALWEGDEDEARRWFAQALDAGLPVFAGAAALLASRLRAGLADGLDPYAVRAVLAAVDRADLGTLTTSFQAGDPVDAAATQQPLESTDGWFEYRREKQELEPALL